MKVLSCFLAMLLLVNVVSSANIASAASLHKGISSLLTKKAGPWINGIGKKTIKLSSPFPATMGIKTDGEKMNGKKDFSMIKGKRFKICMTENKCYKKKLVCPKKCKNAPNHLVGKHFPGQCVLDCKGCVAFC